MKNRIIRSVEYAGVIYDGWLQYCNRESCAGCPHGPYWRKRIKLERGKTITRYVGKTLPPAVAAKVSREVGQ